jgi:aspartyl-tRNA(Asn)/glutamyl-tRNA(Gln) amidotransferase subunit B
MQSVLERWEPVIGLEVHAQLKTKTKIFCGCPTTFGEAPNTNGCPVCHGHPGALPVLNARVVEMAVMTGLGLHCTIQETSIFARKNYFYPDLPKGYQISQFDRPICTEGWLELPEELNSKRAEITRVHLEEDAGKTMHDVQMGQSRVDFNRTGVPLVEIVGEPDLHSADEAMAFLKELRNVLRYLDVCDGNLEEGSFRCDANVSLRPRGSEPFGRRVEVKNINSFRNVGRALNHEIQRQARVLDRGGEIAVETRLFDADKGSTSSMRTKEGSSDYRYFPDPDLLPLVIDRPWINSIQESLPELPEHVRARFHQDYALGGYDVGVLSDDRALAAFFEQTIHAGADPKMASNWIQTEVLRRLASDKQSIDACPIKPEALATLLEFVEKKRITGKMAKDVFEKMWKDNADPEAVVATMGEVVSDESAVEEIVRSVMASCEDEVSQYREGKTKVFGFLMGQVMRESRGKADPQSATAVLRRCLDEGDS